MGGLSATTVELLLLVSLVHGYIRNPGNLENVYKCEGGSVGLDWGRAIETATFYYINNDPDPRKNLVEIASYTMAKGWVPSAAYKGRITTEHHSGVLLSLKTTDSGKYLAVGEYPRQPHEEQGRRDAIEFELYVATGADCTNSLDREMQKLALLLERRIQNLEEEDKYMRNRIYDLEDRSRQHYGAFSARNLNNPSPAAGEVLKFDDVLVDLGIGYDKSTGKLTIRQAGVYIVTAMLQAQGNTKQDFMVDLKVNGQKVAALWKEMTMYDEDVNQSFNLVLKLDRNDVVHLESANWSSSFQQHVPYQKFANYFSAALIQPEYK